jgi:hypothetical protein
VKATIVLSSTATPTYNKNTATVTMTDNTVYVPKMNIAGAVLVAGDYQPVAGTSFDGYAQSLVVRNAYHTPNWLYKTRNREYRNGSTSDDFLVAHWRLNSTLNTTYSNPSL